MEPLRPTFWNIPPVLQYGVYLFTFLTLIVFLYGTYRRIRLWRLGSEGLEFHHVVERLRRLFLYALVQLRLFKECRAGVMHICVFGASIVLFIGTALATLDYDVTLPLMDIRLLRGVVYLAYEIILDMAGLIFVVGISIALYQRHIQRLPRLNGDWKFGFTLTLLLAINITGFIVEGLRLAATQPTWANWSPVGQAVAATFRTLGSSERTMRDLHLVTWLLHGGSALLLVAFIPYINLLHMITSSLNIFFSSLRPKGALPFVRDLDRVVSIGVGEITQFSVSELLSLDACTQCGRCQVVCPAWQAGQPLSPQKVVLDLRDHLSMVNRGTSVQGAYQKVGQQKIRSDIHLVGQVIRPESIWSCTTCYACADACPVLINPMTLIVRMRRYQVEQADIPTSAKRSLEDTLCLGSPWGQPRSERTAWIGDLPVRVLQSGEEADLLYWVGDTSAFDIEAQAIPRAMVQVLRLAGIDFGILGVAEQSDGEASRRLGEEGLFQQIARQNVELLSNYRFKAILTHCPHIYNTFKNEYPEIGGQFRILHHSRFLLDLIQQGVLRPTRPLGERVTYHDPCYLGRYNEVYAEPRRLLHSLPELKLVEMERSRDDALCCGAGGGLAWVDISNGQRINYLRFEEVENAEVRTVATACPLCKMMLCDALGYKQLEHKVRVKDIAELVLETRPERVS